ncbi:MAG TPA: pilus assembly protein [Sphingomicrobium sp.]
MIRPTSPSPAQRLATFTRRLLPDTSGVALIEFSLVLPILVLMALTGSELNSYITTKMRVSQLALQVSDDAARIGAGSRLAAKRINESDINDVFIGAQLQSGELDLLNNGRVIISSLEPVATPNTTNRFRIRWQRCYGVKTSYTPGYGTAGTTNMIGMGPAARQVTAQEGGATMFVEVYFVYKPLIGLGTRAPTTTFTEIASMAVRERRDLSGGNNGIYPIAGVTPSTC